MMNISRIFEFFAWHGFDEFGCNDPLVKLLTNEIDIFYQFLTLLNKSLEYKRQCKESADVTFYWLIGGTLSMFISTNWWKTNFKKIIFDMIWFTWSILEYLTQILQVPSAIWSMFKSGPNKVRGRQRLKILKEYGLL